MKFEMVGRFVWSERLGVLAGSHLEYLYRLAGKVWHRKPYSHTIFNEVAYTYTYYIYYMCTEGIYLFIEDIDKEYSLIKCATSFLLHSNILNSAKKKDIVSGYVEPTIDRNGISSQTTTITTTSTIWRRREKRRSKQEPLHVARFFLLWLFYLCISARQHSVLAVNNMNMKNKCTITPF